jgi:uncharacterized integral membrane protein
MVESMERQNNRFICIFLILILAVMVIEPTTAVTVSFVDEAYLKANDYNITDQSGTPVSNWTGSHTLTFNPGRSYLVNYKPNGLFDLSKEQSTDYTSIGTILIFLKQNLTGLIIIFMAVIGILLWRNT